MGGRGARIVAGLIVLLVVVGVGIVSIGRLSRTDERAGSIVVADAVGDPAARPVEAYSVTYEERVPASGRQTIVVRRPFERRSVTIRADDVEVTSIVTIDAVATIEPSGPLVVASEPAGRTVDPRPAALLRDPLAQGVELRETRRVAERTCQIVRTPGPDASTDGVVTDWCVDRSGIVLEVVEFDAAGGIVRRTVATRVDLVATADDAAFTLPEAPPLTREQGAASVRPLHDSSRLPERDWDLPAPPEGMSLRATYAVAPAQGLAALEPERRDAEMRSIVSVYAAGTEHVAVERGATVGGGEPWTPDTSARIVSAGQLGSGELFVSAWGSELRFNVGSGRFVRVRGSIPPSRLLEIASGLRPGPGGALRCLGDGGAAVAC